MTIYHIVKEADSKIKNYNYIKIASCKIRKHTANNMTNNSFKLLKNVSSKYFSSHSSVGQSVGLMSRRSAVQARL